MISLDTISLVALYSAMSVYAFAFIMFAVDLARRSAGSAVRQHALAGTAGEYSDDPTLNSSGASDSSQASRPSRTLRIAVALFVLAWVLHLGATVLRGIAAERVPWANMYEFALTGTLIIAGIYLALLVRFDLRYLGTFVTGMTLVLLGVAAVQYYVPIVPLPPSLQSYWLIIHVLVALAATGFFAIGFALSCIQLLRPMGERDPKTLPRLRKMLAGLPAADTLETSAYRLNIVGFVLWTFTLIAGAIWAERAWGRYWGWDTKEVWTFIIWVLYAGYVHARATRGWRGSRSAWLGIIGFGAVMFNFGVVNVFFTGLHSYSGL